MSTLRGDSTVEKKLLDILTSSVRLGYGRASKGDSKEAKPPWLREKTRGVYGVKPLIKRTLQKVSYRPN